MFWKSLSRAVERIFGGESESITSVPKTVPYVDLKKYSGLWYEIARYTHWFEEDCVAATATYTLNEDGTVGIVNRCHEKTLDGTLREVSGTAKSTDKTNAKLAVNFGWMVSGDYWTIDLDAEHYTYSVVSSPDRKYLWILSRTPHMDDATYSGILQRLTAQQYDLSKLDKTPQA